MFILCISKNFKLNIPNFKCEVFLAGQGRGTSLAASLRHKLFPPNAWMKLTDFHISTAADRRTLLSAAVPMVLALPHGGAAMFTRSTPGCGTLDGPSLVWATSLWPKLKSSDGSPGLRLPSAGGQLSGLASDHRMEYA